MAHFKETERPRVSLKQRQASLLESANTYYAEKRLSLIFNSQLLWNSNIYCFICWIHEKSYKNKQRRNSRKYKYGRMVSVFERVPMPCVHFSNSNISSIEMRFRKLLHMCVWPDAHIHLSSWSWPAKQVHIAQYVERRAVLFVCALGRVKFERQKQNPTV